MIARGFPGSSVGTESACNIGDPSSIPGSGRYPGKGIDYSSIPGIPARNTNCENIKFWPLYFLIAQK